MYFPAHLGHLNIYKKHVEFEGNCFQSIIMTLEFVENNARVKVKASGKKNEFCSEVLLFGNANICHFEYIFFQENYKFDFKLDSKNFETETKLYGLQVFHFCEKLEDTLISMLSVAIEYIGGLGLHGSIPLF